MNQIEPVEGPVFVVGAHRSGSTLLHLMLNHHPDISAPGEFDFLTEIMADRTSYPSPSEYLQWLSLHRQFLKLEFDCSENRTYESLVKSFVAQLWERNPGRVFVIVAHTGFGALAKLWPNAKFIHIIRDPRDVAASAVKLGWAGNVYAGVQRWLKAETAWNDVCNLVPQSRRHEICFESLVANVTPTLTSLCEFLNVPYSIAMLNYHLNTTYGPPDATLTNQWKKKLTAADIGVVEGVLGDKLQSAGYQASGHRIIKPNCWMTRRLLIEDRVSRLRVRLRRFGLTNTLGVAIARRLRLRGVERHFQLQINEISLRGLK